MSTYVFTLDPPYTRSKGVVIIKAGGAGLRGGQRFEFLDLEGGEGGLAGVCTCVKEGGARFESQLQGIRHCQSYFVIYNNITVNL